MDEMKLERTWREALKNLCEFPNQKQAIAETVGTSVRTIDRWMSGTTQPQNYEYLRNLSTLSAEMSQLLQKEYPEAFQQKTKRHLLPIEQTNLPAEFFRRVVHAYAYTAPSLRRWAIFHLVSNQMIPHLDSEKSGLMMIYVKIPSTAQLDEVSLEEGSGNGVWTTRQVFSSTCREPWLVQAIRSFRPFFMQSISSTGLVLPSCFANHELIQSVGFFPVNREGKIAGGMLFLSTVADFFTPLRQTLIEEYSCLLALAFGDKDFH